MSISERLFQHCQGLQDRADNWLNQPHVDSNVLPNDAIYLLRVTNLNAVLAIIQEGVEGSGQRKPKDLKTVLNLAIKPNLEVITKHYPFTGPALNALIRDFAN